jgi:beta-glucosidase
MIQVRCILSLLLLALCAGCSTSQKPGLTRPEPTCEALRPKQQDSAWSNGWWPQRHAALLEVGSKGDADLIIIGDSITHWFDRKPKYIWDEYYGKRRALNLGFAADCTDHVLWRLRNGEISGIRPKLAVIMIGTNNTGNRKDPPQETAAGIKAIITELKIQVPGTKILLLAIFPRGQTPEDPKRKVNDQVNTMIATYADDRTVWFLDIGKHFLDDKGNLNKDVSRDRLHLTEKGYTIWAEAMEPMVKKLMGE